MGTVAKIVELINLAPISTIHHATSSDKSVLYASACCRKGQKSGPGQLYAQVADHSERNALKELRTG